METFILTVIGAVFIFSASDVNRKEDSKIKIYSKHWWIQLVLVIIGLLLIRNAIN